MHVRCILVILHGRMASYRVGIFALVIWLEWLVGFSRGSEAGQNYRYVEGSWQTSGGRQCTEGELRLDELLVLVPVFRLA